MKIGLLFGIQFAISGIGPAQVRPVPFTDHNETLTTHAAVDGELAKRLRKKHLISDLSTVCLFTSTFVCSALNKGYKQTNTPWL